MSEYTIKEDRSKLVLYTVLDLFITLVLIILCANFYSMGAFLFAFLSITGLWFSIKAMLKYGSTWWKHTPICEFGKQAVILHALPYGKQTMKYSEIKEVKILRDQKSVKLFFSGDQVGHPSGYYYVGANYLFQRSLLDEVEQISMECLKQHKVMVRKVEKVK